MHNPIALLSLAVATPDNVLTQPEAAETARRLFSDRSHEFKYLARVFETAGIERRHSAQPLSWFEQPHGWFDRMTSYKDVASDLFRRTVSAALLKAEVQAHQVDCIVVASSTGISTPGIEARLAREMGFRTDVERVPLFGLGCAAGVSGLAVAAKLAATRPGATVLFVAIELCSLAFRLDDLTRANIVATALFADGAAACVLRSGEGGIAEIETMGEHLFPDSLDVMGWRIDDTGFGIILEQSLPSFAEKNLRSAVAGILDRSGLGIHDVQRFICHPGGAKILIALEEALEIEAGSLDIERDVIRDYGNMSSPTVLFVLERAIEKGLPARSALLAMGPGFSASCMTLKRAA